MTVSSPALKNNPLEGYQFAISVIFHFTRGPAISGYILLAKQPASEVYYV